MRKIIVSTSVSLDGYMEGPDHDLSWHRVDEEVHAHFNEVLGASSVFLEGRVTHELMADFWPTADEDPEAPAAVAEYARIWREMPKIVFSRTLQHDPWTADIRREVVPEEIRELQAQPGGDMVVGGADLADSFRRHDLVDEYRIYVHPVLVGAGTRWFRPFEGPASLQHLETRTFGNGVVLLRYGRPSAA
jgi:dihydrofolate reductase